MATLVEESKLVSSQDSKSIKARSKFDLSHHHLTTLPFGMVVPFFNMETVNGDHITLRSQHSLNTFTLRSPILSNIKMRKDYFSVPMEAILPFNWDKIYTNPLFGDDIDAEHANCTLTAQTLFYSYDSKKMDAVFNTLASSTGFKPAQFFNILTLLELFYSEGSLLARLGYNLSPLLNVSLTETNKSVKEGIDAVVDYFYSNLPNGTYTVFVNTDTNGTFNQQTFSVNSLSDKRKVHDYIVNHCVSNITYFGDTGTTKAFAYPENFVYNKYQLTLTNTSKTGFFTLNVSAAAAYQISYIHYMTNDKVDNIYSAQLYRDMMRYFITDEAYFSYNGVQTRYDYLAGTYIYQAVKGIVQQLINNLTTDTFSNTLGYKCMGYIVNLFGMRRSLRYLDYFTGAKTHPLALGDTSVSVQSNKVDVVDITKGISMQRFLNFVNRTGRKFEEYVSKLGGTYVKPDFHNPQFLGSTTESLYNPTVENTGAMQFEAQNSITSTLRGESEKFAFEFDSDRPSIVLGLVSFDIVRSYSKNIKRDAFHIDRFDYFNEFLQNIGDQPVYAAEYMALPDNMLETRVFGYQTRNAEYKNEYSRADAGFSTGVLPSWAFLNQLEAAKDGVAVIDSDRIRSYPEELDEFYLSLPGVGNSTYFHFIVDFYNVISASRPMIANPNIL